MWLCPFRVKKLKETLVTMQQLDKNMSNLRSWLSRIEAELSRPITYSICHEQEIQRRLAEQQVDLSTFTTHYDIIIIINVKQAILHHMIVIAAHHLLFNFFPFFVNPFSLIFVCFKGSFSLLATLCLFMINNSYLSFV